MQIDDIQERLQDAGYEKEASSVMRVRDDLSAGSKSAKPAVLTFLSTCAVWVGTWIMVLLLYPRYKAVRLAFLSPSILRRIWGLGFVDFVLLQSGWVRRRLLSPFRSQLLGKAALDPDDEASYFEEFEVAALDKGSEKNGTCGAFSRRLPGRLSLKLPRATARHCF
jgi:hypothetical protein